MAVEPPTANPIINLPMTKITIDCANDRINAPTIKTIAITNTSFLRPSLSDSGPLNPEPNIAPTNIELTTKPSVKLVSGISFL